LPCESVVGIDQQAEFFVATEVVERRVGTSVEILLKLGGIVLQSWVIDRATGVDVLVAQGIQNGMIDSRSAGLWLIGFDRVDRWRDPEELLPFRRLTRRSIHGRGQFSLVEASASRDQRVCELSHRLDGAMVSLLPHVPKLDESPVLGGPLLGIQKLGCGRLLLRPAPCGRSNRRNETLGARLCLLRPRKHARAERALQFRRNVAVLWRF